MRRYIGQYALYIIVLAVPLVARGQVSQEEQNAQAQSAFQASAESYSEAAQGFSGFERAATVTEEISASTLEGAAEGEEIAGPAGAAVGAAIGFTAGVVEAVIGSENTSSEETNSSGNSGESETGGGGEEPPE